MGTTPTSVVRYLAVISVLRVARTRPLLTLCVRACCHVSRKGRLSVTEPLGHPLLAGFEDGGGGPGRKSLWVGTSDNVRRARVMRHSLTAFGPRVAKQAFRRRSLPKS